MVSAIERFYCTLIGTYHDFTTPWPGGEPLNENAYWWLHNVVGEGRLTVVDNAWQTGERIIVRIVTLYRTRVTCEVSHVLGLHSSNFVVVSCDCISVV